MDRMPREPSPSRRDVWFYPAAWLALLMLYSAAFVAAGMALAPALRNGIANLLPDALDLADPVLQHPAGPVLLDGGPIDRWR